MDVFSSTSHNNITIHQSFIPSLTTSEEVNVHLRETVNTGLFRNYFLLHLIKHCTARVHYTSLKAVTAIKYEVSVLLKCVSGVGRARHV